MQIEIFTIADAATVSGGKLNLLGSFDQLIARTFPAHHDASVVVCKLRLEHEDSGDHALALHIIDPDGVDVIAPSNTVFTSEIPDEGTGDHVHLWHILEFPLAKPGVFYIDAMVDGVLIARTPLHVVQAE